MKRTAALAALPLFTLTLAACNGETTPADAREEACGIVLNPTELDGDEAKLAERLQRLSTEVDDTQLAGQLGLMASGLKDNNTYLVNESAEIAAGLCGGQADTESEPEAEETAMESAEPTSVLSEQDALAALASISSSATTEQWKSIAQGVCDQYKAEAKPLDEAPDTSVSVATYIWSQPLFAGTGETVAQIPGSDLKDGQMGMLLLGSTELLCPEWTPDAMAYAKTIDE